MASTNIQTFPGKVGVSNTNPIHTLDVGSNVYIDDTGANKLTVTGNIHASGITLDGDVTIINTQNLSVKDPVILLASESTGTSDTGIIMKRADGDANVAVFYDEGAGLKICHTMSGADDTQLTADTSNALNTTIYGPVTIENTTAQALSIGGGAQVDGDFQVGEVANLFVDTSTSNVGIGTATPAYTLDVVGDINLSGDFYQGGSPFVSSLWTEGVDSLYYRSNVEVGTGNLFVDTTTSNVGIGTTTPGYSLDVVGDINLTGDFYQGGSPFVSSLWTSSGTDLYYNAGSVGIANSAPAHNLSVGSNLYVDDVGSNVLVVDGNVNISNTLTLNNFRITPSSDLQTITDQGSTTTNQVQITNSTESTNSTTGALTVVGGVGVASNLHVAGTANVETLVTTSATVYGNVYVPDMHLATIASNLMTYDSSTGLIQDSGGLFSNKLAVVSEQPPSALSGASTTVEKHGIYKVTASTGTPQDAFDKATNTMWTGSSDYIGGGVTGVYDGSVRLATGLQQGDWIAVELPYKATLRHLTLSEGDSAATSFPEKANLYATNDSLTWTELKNWEAGETTLIVNASAPYKKFALVTTKTKGNTTLKLGQLKLFCESFSVDGGKVEMATSAVTGGETVMDQTTGHGREPAVLKKYPEVAFADGKFEYNHDSNTYTQGGYTVSGSSSNATHTQYRAFDGDASTFAHTGTGDSFGGNSYAYDGTNSLGGISGYWHKLQLPYKIKLNRVKLRARSGYENQAPNDFTFIGSNDDTNWTTIQTFTGQSPQDDGSSYYNITSNPIAYKYLAIVTTRTVGDAIQCSFAELEYYGYEETNTTGDTSLDTTITSKYNTPDLTNASLYLDGLKGSTATDYSGNDLTVTENNVTYDSTEKAWELTGDATSNIVTADLGFEGDQPHSISAWVKANQLNGDGLFHVGTAEGEGDAASRVGFVDDSHISWGGEDHYFSNAEWHNVTYTYNGEGSEKKLYLDGRLVGSAKNEDTFGEYPPFAMSTTSQYGYTVSASSTSGNPPYRVFSDGDTASDFWRGATRYDQDSSTWSYKFGPLGETDPSGYPGDWLKIEFPYKIVLSLISVLPNTYNGSYEYARLPKNGYIWASNDGRNFVNIFSIVNKTNYSEDNTYRINSNRAYKYFVIHATEINGYNDITFYRVRLFGHRENDLVRFPDPTNVLKYPHVAMTGPAQRGYVATASSMFGTTQHPYLAFDTNSSADDPYRWVSGDDHYNTSGVYTRSPPAGFTDVDGSTENGEWLKIQLPRKVLVSYFETVAYPTNGAQMLRNYAILGSNDDSTWYQVHKVTGSTTLLNNTSTITPSGTYASTAFKYFAFVWLDCADTVNRHVSMGELRLYGTEEDLDVVARIGDGYDGKVRNLRVFSTALSQDRVQEIFDADKDEFGLAKSSVSVYRGHLGIGTTEPKAALTVMDEVADLEEFPPRAMTDYETYMEGHGVFKAYMSSDYELTPYRAWNAFDKTVDRTIGNNGWASKDGTWQPGSTLPDTSNCATFDGIYCEWLALEMPYKVKLEKVGLQARNDGNVPHEMPKRGRIYGSNDRSTWTKIHDYSNLPAFTQGSTYYLDINTSEYYKHILLTADERYSASSGTSPKWVDIGELRYFGTREQGASTLHNGELTLTRNLTVPRIGPALDADDTPRRDRLVVEYNTFENPTENGVVKDTSGRGLDGTLYNGAAYDATEKALAFDGTDDYITTSLSSTVSGGWAHTVSFWFNLDTLTNDKYFTFIGAYTARKGIGTLLYGTNKFVVTTLSTELYGTTVVQSSRWYHAVVVYRGSTVNSTNVDIYLDGVKEAISSEVSPNTIDITSPKLNIGTLYGTSHFTNGSISNFKLYDVALTADEVKRLYDMGRHGNVIAKPLYITAPLHAPGSIVQLQTRTFCLSYSTTSSTYTDTGAYVDIIPKFANSKLFVMFDCLIYLGGNGAVGAGLKGYRSINGGTDQQVYAGEEYSGATTNPHNLALYANAAGYMHSRVSLSFGDTPNTSSSVRYKIYARSHDTGTVYLGNGGHQPITFSVFEIAT